MTIFKQYPGSKHASGTYHTIINCIRPHDRFISAFLGNCAIVQRKKPAKTTLGNDLSTTVIDRWKQAGPPWVELSNLPASNFLQSLHFPGGQRTTIYLDPPYPMGSRKNKRRLYEHEMSDEDHEQLLTIALTLPCDVLISTYPNDLYADVLKDWNCLSFEVMTHTGKKATELLYLNYDNPTFELHDYSYLGEDYREREYISNRRRRELRKLNRMNPYERNALLAGIHNQPWYPTGISNGDGLSMPKIAV